MDLEKFEAQRKRIARDWDIEDGSAVQSFLSVQVPLLESALAAARAEVAEQRAGWDDARGLLGLLQKTLNESHAERDELRAEVERIRAWMRDHAEHDVKRCKARRRSCIRLATCTCGLGAALGAALGGDDA